MEKAMRPKRLADVYRLEVLLGRTEQAELGLIQKIVKDNLGLPTSLSALMRAAVPVYLHHLCSNLADKDKEWAETYAELEKGRIVKINGLNPDRIPENNV
jgi:hypothetical protein